jgi:hypothetical protein
MAKVITAIFTAQSKALQAVEDLVAHDYAKQDISLLMDETTGGRHFALTESTKANTGLALGAAFLGIVGALAFGLTSVGQIAAPGLAIYTSGQYVSALAGFGFGALLGGLIGGLIGLSMPEHKANFLAVVPRNNNILLGVISGDPVRTDEALKLVQSNGAAHIWVDNLNSKEVKRADAA